MASFWDFDWGAHMHVQGNSPYKAETILATAYEDPKHMKGIGVGWDEQIHFIRSDDFFASAHDKLASCGNQFEIAAHKVPFVLQSAVRVLGSSSRLAGGLGWDFGLESIASWPAGFCSQLHCSTACDCSACSSAPVHSHSQA